MSRRTFHYLLLTSRVKLSRMLPYIIYVMDSGNHSFIDMNRHVKLNFLSEFELLLNQVSSSIPVFQHEDCKHSSSFTAF